LLEDALFNLVINAIDATLCGGTGDHLDEEDERW